MNNIQLKPFVGWWTSALAVKQRSEKIANQLVAEHRYKESLLYFETWSRASYVCEVCSKKTKGDDCEKK